MAYRVLVVDDSALIRKELVHVLSKEGELIVVGQAQNGKEALEKIQDLKPDVVTLDLNMPVMGGMECLDRIMSTKPLPVVVISSLTQEGAAETLQALEKGAFDYVSKPSADEGSASGDLERQAALIRVKVLSAAKNGKRALHKPFVGSAPRVLTSRPAEAQPARAKRIGVIGIGVSTGGPKTLMRILPQLPKETDACILIAQHMPATFTPTFAERLNQICQMSVSEAKHGDPIKAGHIYVAPGGRHMEVVGITGDFRIAIVEEDRGQIYVPSVAVLFASLNQCYHNFWLGVMLTGMGADGADELCRLRKNGGHTICQSEQSCVVYGMPQKVVIQGGAEFILSEEEIAEKMLHLSGRRHV